MPGGAPARCRGLPAGRPGAKERVNRIRGGVCGSSRRVVPIASARRSRKDAGQARGPRFRSSRTHSSVPQVSWKGAPAPGIGISLVMPIVAVLVHQAPPRKPQRPQRVICMGPRGFPPGEGGRTGWRPRPEVPGSPRRLVRFNDLDDVQRLVQVPGVLPPLPAVEGEDEADGCIRAAAQASGLSPGRARASPQFQVMTVFRFLRADRYTGVHRPHVHVIIVQWNTDRLIGILCLETARRGYPGGGVIAFGPFP